MVPWESFRAEIEAVVLTPDELKKSSAGRKPFDAILMFRMLVLQALNNLCADSARLFVSIADDLCDLVVGQPGRAIAEVDLCPQVKIDLARTVGGHVPCGGVWPASVLAVETPEGRRLRELAARVNAKSSEVIEGEGLAGLLEAGALVAPRDLRAAAERFDVVEGSR